MKSASSVARIAHVSDVHMLGGAGSRASSASVALSTRFVSFGRSLDPLPRRQKLLAALRASQERGAAHVVISGDLTEVGSDPQFEALAEVLHESRLPPERVVLVPGNHDAYTRPDAWASALAGPLAGFRRTSAAPSTSVPSSFDVVDRGSVLFLPLDVACHQRITRSAGELGHALADVLERRIADLSGRGRALVVVLHHPPFEHASRTWQWVDGLRNAKRLMGMLERFEDVHVLHGHLHHVVDRAPDGGRPRIFGARATVEDRADAPTVRLYDVYDGVLSPVKTATTTTEAPRRPAAAA